MKPIRLGLIGYGKWGRNYVAAARDSGEAEVVRIMRRRIPYTKIDIGPPLVIEPAYIDGILETGMGEWQDAVDAVVVAAHPADAPRLAGSALAMGKPVLIEKPAGLSRADALGIAADEAHHRGLVLVGHLHLFAEGFEALRALALGSLFEGFVTATGPVRRDYTPWLDYGPHAASMALGLLGGGQLELGGEIAPDLRGGVLVHHGRQSFVVAGSRDARVMKAVINLSDKTSITYDAYASEAEPPLTRQVRAFARAVRAGGTDDYRFGARWAVNVARILESAGAE